MFSHRHFAIPNPIWLQFYLICSKFICPFTAFLRRSPEKVTGKVKKFFGGVFEECGRDWAQSCEHPVGPIKPASRPSLIQPGNPSRESRMTRIARMRRDLGQKLSRTIRFQGCGWKTLFHPCHPRNPRFQRRSSTAQAKILFGVFDPGHESFWRSAAMLFWASCAAAVFGPVSMIC